MASTYSTRLRLEKQGAGENDTTWGTKLNTVIELVDAAIAGMASVTHDDTANYTLTASNAIADEARNMILNIAGTLTAARNAVVPTVSKFYVVKNATVGGYAVTVKTSGGTGISVPNGKTMLLYCDGTNVVDAVNQMSALAIAGLLDLSGAAAGQIKFPAAQNPSADANTLDDYEEVDWTPVDGSGAGLSLTNNTQATCVKVGQLVHAEFDITFPATADGTNALIGGLPFTAKATDSGWGIMFSFQNVTAGLGGRVVAGSTTFNITAIGTLQTNANLSGKTIRGIAIYRAAA